jgi:hypothetical protein
MQGFQRIQQANDTPPMDPGDEKLFVQFYMGALRNEEKSETEGRPIYDAVPFVKILVPGDKSTLIDTIADASHKRRFARMWQQFEQNEKQEISGTPVRDWPAITRAQAEELSYHNVLTVEQIATLADVYGAKIMGFHDLKRKAEAFVAAAKDSAFAQKMAKENQALKDRISAQEEEIRRLSDLFESLTAGMALKGQMDDDSTGTRAKRSG